MINCEQDLLVNLIELSPRNARRKFRQSIFESWEWKCAYCDKELDTKSATIDHIVPKFKGGHNVKSNMILYIQDEGWSFSYLPSLKQMRNCHIHI